MRISKSMFKEYSRCPRVSALDDLYVHKLDSLIKFNKTSNEEKKMSLLNEMFSEDGDDLINYNNDTALLIDYFNKVEENAIRYASDFFGKEIIYSKDTMDQKSFSFLDKDHNEFYCYVDGYLELEEQIIILEVKAITASKFYSLGTKKKSTTKFYKGIDKYNSIFYYDDNKVLKLKEKADSNLSLKVFENHYNKLFDRYSDVGQYVYDLAIQRYIIENSMVGIDLGNKKIEYYLLVLNDDYVFNGLHVDSNPVYATDENGNDLFVLVDLTRVTYDYQRDIEKIKQELVFNINDLDGSAYRLGRHCQRKKPNRCPFVDVCWKEVNGEGSIYEYINNHYGFVDEHGYRHKTIDLVNAGCYTLDSIPSSWLRRQENIIQLQCHAENKEYINKDKIRDGIKLIQYPIYHLDFETFPSPLPRFKGESPYSQSVFQFSVHIEREDKTIDLIEDNYSFLAQDHNDHRESLIRALINTIDLSNGGTVLVYNKNFEYQRILELMKIFPEYQEQLNIINNHMFDLYDLLRGNALLYQGLGYSVEEAKMFNYYHPQQRGSFSIKYVLPVFSNLSYDDLQVSNGAEAFSVYANYHRYEADDLEDVYNSLIEYCRQDTWAMVVILQELKNKVK